jgi:hypothetical protein
MFNLSEQRDHVSDGATKSESKKMWNHAVSELRECLWLVSMVAGLSAVGVSFAVVLAIVLTNPI